MFIKNKNFLWGVVNIGQQTEGVGDENFDVPGESNWERWVRRGLVPEIGVANNYWQDYKNDHDLVKDIGCNSMRITVEWVRIESVEGVFDQQAVAYYRKILLRIYAGEIFLWWLVCGIGACRCGLRKNMECIIGSALLFLLGLLNWYGMNLAI